MKLYIGSSGFAYPAWKGKFYPEKLKSADFLGFYAGHFNSVEINGSFMRLPTEKSIEQWNDATGKDFVFSFKANRYVSHMKRLKEGAEESLSKLIQVTEAMGKKRGPILIQLPENFKADSERLAGFLSRLPDGARYALEFRHSSWLASEEICLLLARNRVTAVYSDETGEPFHFASAETGYFRLRAGEYTQSQLAEIAELVLDSGYRQCHVYFMHDDAATAISLAERFSPFLKEN